MLEILAALGLTFILKQGRIFNEIRLFLISKNALLKDLFNCAMCLGFWSGLFIALISLKPFIDCFIFALCVSFLGFLVQHILIVLEKFYNKL